MPHMFRFPGSFRKMDEARRNTDYAQLRFSADGKLVTEQQPVLKAWFSNLEFDGSSILQGTCCGAIPSPPKAIHFYAIRAIIGPARLFRSQVCT